MKKNSNVQKSNELKKEAEISSAKNETSKEETKKVTFIGENVKSLYTNDRYKSLSFLIDQIEKDLEEPLPFDVNLSCLTLESFAKAFKELGTYGFSIIVFNNIKPINFFKLLNDISIQNYYTSSKKVATKFLTSDKMLSKLNRFYTEYQDVYDYCIKNKYTSLYLFEITAINNNENLKEYFPNLSTYLHSNDKQKRHIISSLFNELENEVRRCGITEATINEYYYKVIRIDKEIEKIFTMIDLSEIYSIDSLYYKLYQ